MTRKSFALATLAAVLPLAVANAQFTYNSPTGQPLPAAVTPVGGIVVDFIGLNGNRIVAQRAASGLFNGFIAGNAQTVIGTQSGFAGLLGSLGGGIAQAGFRVTLFDGDSRLGNFDFNNNWLLVNGIRVGNFSGVSTIETTGLGAPIGAGNVASGFGNNILNTGFFFTNNAADLASIFASLAGGTITYTFEDEDPSESQFLDFTQGVDGSLIDTNVPPVVVPPSVGVVPEPSTYALMVTGLLGLAGVVRRRRNASV